MSKLLSAEFTRLFKSFIFRLGVLFSAGLGIVLVLMRWLDVKMNADEYAELAVVYSSADELIFTGAVILIFAMAAFIGIFLGTEYSDGTIRNKLTAGHTRGGIYLSKLLVCIAADGIMHSIYILVVLGFGRLLLSGTTMKAAEILKFTLVGVMAVFALTAVLLLLSTSIQSKAIGAVVCLLTTLVMLFAATIINSKLEEPEYYEGYSYLDTETGEMIEVEKEKNPRYLTGTKREVYIFLNDFLPVCQLFQIAMRNGEKLARMAVYDCVMMIAITGLGTVVFKKKNLR